MADTPEARDLALSAILPSGTDVYVALFLGDPLDTGVELTLGGYARVAHQDWLTTPGVGTSSRANIGAITFPAVTDGGSCDYWAIYDADAPGGTLLRSGQLLDGIAVPTAIVLGVGDNVEFPDGALTITATEA